MSKFLIFLILFLPLGIRANEMVVSNELELRQAIKKAVPGDIITMRNGVWENIEIVFKAAGTSKKKITLKAETSGKVFIEGSSNLKIAGDYLVIKGLIFKNGFSPSNEVISFRKDSKTLANNCRLTEVVIDNFNAPKRYEVSTWVMLYGKENRVDHSSFLNKRTQGVTLVVRLNTLESINNNHLIDHNYFGPRQNHGSNGGETIRIGTSHFSMMDSKSRVEFNYFDRCDGEVEIISNKSNKNTYRSNTFYECKGTLTMRHGNETLVESNVFFGNGSANTGGIRVINEKQTVINNYCEGLTGNRFRGALTVMNGVPNSPLNRYVGVKESRIDGNSIINCDHIELCAGSDEERSVVPQSTSITRNLIVSDSPNMFGVYDDISGLTFENNIASSAIEVPSKDGFRNKKISLERNDLGLLVTKGSDFEAGAKIKDFAKKSTSGVDWYISDVVEKVFGTGSVKEIKPGMNTLLEAIKNSKPGDNIVLLKGEYVINREIIVPHSLTISSEKKAKVIFEKGPIFNVTKEGSLKLSGLRLVASKTPQVSRNFLIIASQPMIKNYKVFIENCDFSNLGLNEDFSVLAVAPEVFADTISIKNSSFEGLFGALLAHDHRIDEIAFKNAETVIIENCSFKGLKSYAANYFQNEMDDSLEQKRLNVNHCYYKNLDVPEIVNSAGDGLIGCLKCKKGS